MLVRTPGKCVQTDGYEMMGELFAQTEELVIVSRCVYGSFSPFVKMVLTGVFLICFLIFKSSMEKCII